MLARARNRLPTDPASPSPPIVAMPLLPHNSASPSGPNHAACAATAIASTTHRMAGGEGACCNLGDLPASLPASCGTPPPTLTLRFPSLTSTHSHPPPLRRCKCGGCSCPHFFYIVAQGAWILRCRCKHKHVEHNAASRACAKPGCACGSFDSPWVCNCDCPWGDHQQKEVEDRPCSGIVGAVGLLEAAAAEVNAWGSVQRGAGADG